MKKGIWIPLSAILLGGASLTFQVFKRAAKIENQSDRVNESKANDRSPIHPSSISATPGDCLSCGTTAAATGKNMDAAPSKNKADAEIGRPEIAYYRDPMHPWITSDKPGKSPDCGMDMVPVSAQDPSVKGVRIDPGIVQNMNVETETVKKMNLQTEIRTSGKVEVEETRIAIVNVRVMGYVEKLWLNYTGQSVSKNQPLFDLYSPDLVGTQEEYLQAIRYAEKMDPRLGSDPQDLVESSRRRLLNWGVSEAEIRALERRGQVQHTLSIVSPVRGVVLEKMVAQGQNVMPGMELYEIADLSRVWVVAEVYQSDLSSAKVGAQAEVELNYLPARHFTGKVTFISPVLDEQTKTGEVRIELRNTPSLDLKPKMFATVRIRAPALTDVVAVPEQAIIHSGRRNIAIIALGGGYFEPREVKLGIGNGAYVQVLEGIRAGEKLVVSSQFLIDSESNLNAALQQLKANPGGDRRSDTLPTMETKPEMPDSSAAAMK